MNEERVTGRLSEKEADTLAALLHRYCEYNLDQFELWKLRTAYGPVYVTITREPAPGVAPQTYIELPASDTPAGSSALPSSHPSGKRAKPQG
ncbi:hypothetical protein [Actinoallomurus rhizosphaericola]|uniref:hypothetical protein n=1 Tax=Actinoallomurus rhizosphaericola TaxID=2952536 RepID=UPI0020931DFA|nr:hypothetical protein [Actinoallomurus rhizosphaericola]MCO5998655.1 hypothetical protein [Actinoallomurus rhizosphaericola]